MTLHKLTPFIRYALLIIAGMAARGGWLDPVLADEIARDPYIIEAVAGAVLGALTLLWYWYSTSRKALKEAMGR
ncbi:hypothetical protein PVV74_11855 [Roseovarius sp. SK2]|uniref:Pam3-gp28 family putative phage holin n=1 Tax=Roseovarius TaxID=74030 RepID=UPI00237B7153|nr:hypothetical protein [Roseovarius sp. SK2]MDD9726152.1 hypothetical protein [Roseovarius sp. SK2]